MLRTFSEESLFVVCDWSDTVNKLEKQRSKVLVGFFPLK